MKFKSLIIVLIFCAHLVSCLPKEKRAAQIDDAEVIEAADTAGSITQPDGPGPSLLGSLDNIFHSVKNFDQYHCIERMVCEYMQGNEDVSGVGSLLGGSGALSGIPGLSGLTGLLGGQSSGPTQGFTQPVGQPPVRGQFPPGPPPPGFSPGFPAGPSGFARPPRRSASFVPPPQQSSGSGFFGAIENLLFGSKRRSGREKRQTSLQGNLIRLMQATKLDNLNAFPYVRAALVGYGTRNQGSVGVRRGQACSQLYRECPTEPNQLLNYINNHNGGLVNQVQPSVDNEVAPILSAIVSDMLGSSSSSSAATTSSPTFAAADSFITNALVQGASGPFSNALKSIVNMVSGNSGTTK